jgi:uncharacterized protein YbaP (TraB family)
MGAAYRNPNMNVKCSTHKTRPVWPMLLLALLAVAMEAAAGRFDRGLLWKIEVDNAAPSYLFGTMHSDDPAVVRLPDAVRQAFDTSRGLTLEVLLDARSLLAMTAGLMLAPGETLEARVGPDLYRRTVDALAAHSVPEIMVSGMKPWAVAVTLMTPPTETGEVLDMRLYSEAVAAGKPVDGLETPLEQLSVFEELSDSDQVELLRDTLDNLPEMGALLEELKQAYLSGDLRRLVEISDRSMQDSDPELVERFNTRLIDERNHRMAERMQARLEKGGQFIAVGALHLPGEEGVLNLLSRKGYRLSVVK